MKLATITHAHASRQLADVLIIPFTAPLSSILIPPTASVTCRNVPKLLQRRRHIGLTSARSFLWSHSSRSPLALEQEGHIGVTRRWNGLYLKVDFE